MSLRLNIGCGARPLQGFTNCDLYPGPEVDAAFDCQKDWPFADDSASLVYASHLLEHLPDHFAFFREAHRVLEPGGRLFLRVPYGGNRMAWIDSTHVRPWFPPSFGFLQPGYAEDIYNTQHAAWTAHFGVTVDLRVGPEYRRWLRFGPTRRWLLRYGEDVPNLVHELWMRGVALKTPAAVTHYRAEHGAANYIVTRYCMWDHQWEGRPGRPDGWAYPVWIDGVRQEDMTPWR